MSNVVDDILDGTIALLEGSAGSGRTITAGLFKHIESEQASINANTAAGPTRPFTLEITDHIEVDGETMGLAGSHVHGAHEMLVSVLYSLRPHAAHDLQKDITDDEYLIRRCLQWPNNWETVEGWTGCEIQGASRELYGDGEKQDLVMLTITTVIRHREEQA